MRRKARRVSSIFLEVHPHRIVNPLGGRFDQLLFQPLEPCLGLLLIDRDGLAGAGRPVQPVGLGRVDQIDPLFLQPAEYQVDLVRRDGLIGDQVVEVLVGQVLLALALLDEFLDACFDLIANRAGL
jgi:hypothetical protein